MPSFQNRRYISRPSCIDNIQFIIALYHLQIGSMCMTILEYELKRHKTLLEELTKKKKTKTCIHSYVMNVSVLLICACNFLDSEYSAKTDVSSSKKEYEKGKKKYQSVLKKQETLLRGKTNKKSSLSIGWISAKLLLALFKFEYAFPSLSSFTVPSPELGRGHSSGA